MKNKKAYLALATVSVVWGTTFLAIRIGVKSFPPFLFAGIRQFTAGLILWFILFFSKRKMVSDRKNTGRQVIAGVLMLTLSNGMVSWAEKYIPSGLTALIRSVMPIYVVLINLMGGSLKHHVNWKVLFGILLGSIGVVLIFRDNLNDLGNIHYLMGILAVFAATLCYTIGTLYIKAHKNNKTDPLVNIAIQMSSGGSLLFIGSFFLDDFSHSSSVSLAGLCALAYLIIFGSLIAYLCYVYAVNNLPVGLVSVYTYINPLIAIVVGWLWLREKVTWITALAFIVTLGGVFFINKGYKYRKQ